MKKISITLSIVLVLLGACYLQSLSILNGKINDLQKSNIDLQGENKKVDEAYYLTRTSEITNLSKNCKTNLFIASSTSNTSFECSPAMKPVVKTVVQQAPDQHDAIYSELITGLTAYMNKCTGFVGIATSIPKDYGGVVMSLREAKAGNILFACSVPIKN